MTLCVRWIYEDDLNFKVRFRKIVTMVIATVEGQP